MGAKRISKEFKEKALKLFQQGLSYRATASKLGLNWGTVRDWHLFYRSGDTSWVNSQYRKTDPSILQKLTGQEWIQYRSFNKTDVINELKKENPVIVRYKGNGGFARSSSHFVAILSISEDGSKIYVSNPASRKDGISTGWLKTSYLDASGYCEYIKLK